MDENTFWSLIEKVKITSKDDIALRPHVLKNHLLESDPAFIESFNQFLVNCVSKALSNKLKSAVFLIKGYRSDYDFIPYIDYLISEGKTIFEIALHQPDDLADIALANNESYVAIEYRSVVHEAYEELTERDIPDFTFSFPTEDLTSDFNKFELSKEFPKLIEKYGN
ncbi:DUF4240 domain-containing protein [Pseudoalteromonas peptidolytica]|uniref:DUF4240 domain-containing protein n=1 Tax=Pseudoalteromonas peptidolytica TaxID=61150 RepID=UPI00298DDB9F|nr:DUF4240 domain-containing protein [Pseudoalteromonas peptidolytica]MDW7547654.1 DUF4240 domain-containing protein [Pseudoalteromonas peptidolytica]